MTSFVRDLDLKRLRDELDVAQIVSKPFSPVELVAAVEVLTTRVEDGAQAFSLYHETTWVYSCRACGSCPDPGEIKQHSFCKFE